jgi:hypothetical protein
MAQLGAPELCRSRFRAYAIYAIPSNGPSRSLQSLQATSGCSLYWCFQFWELLQPRIVLGESRFLDRNMRGIDQLGCRMGVLEGCYGCLTAVSRYDSVQLIFRCVSKFLRLRFRRQLDIQRRRHGHESWSSFWPSRRTILMVSAICVFGTCRPVQLYTYFGVSFVILQQQFPRFFVQSRLRIRMNKETLDGLQSRIAKGNSYGIRISARI